MKMTAKLATIAALSLLGTGCATKKYVAQTVAPIDARVTGTETKNTEQDKQIAEHGKNIEELDRSTSRTREQLKDTDAKAVAAGEAAAKADQKLTAPGRQPMARRVWLSRGSMRTRSLPARWMR